MGTVYGKEYSTFTHSDEAESGGGRAQEKKIINLQNVQARVDKVNVEGLVRTKDTIIKRTIKDLFHVKNFEEVIKQTHKVRGKLEELGCFRNISILIDTSRGPGATPNGYEITYVVNELNRVKGGLQTALHDTNEASIVISAQAPNLFGGAEALEAEYSYGSRRSKTFCIGYKQPFFLDLDAVFGTNVFQNDEEWPASGFKLINRGTIIDLSFFLPSKIKHSVQWEGAWRETSAHRYAAFSVRENVGHTLKSSLRHTMTVDSRNSKIFPNYGSLVNCITEYAGVGGNVGFFKNELQFQHNIEILPDTVIQGAFAGGFMNEVGGENKNIYICDRFFLGGPLSLRGFNNRGIGPFSDGNYIGGKLYMSGALHLYSPLPFRPKAGGLGDFFRTHIFVNAGNLSDLPGKENWFTDLRSTIRLAYGAGVVVRIGQMARIELNYVIPVYVQEKDSVNKGVQFGIGLHFL